MQCLLLCKQNKAATHPQETAVRDRYRLYYKQLKYSIKSGFLRVSSKVVRCEISIAKALFAISMFINSSQHLDLALSCSSRGSFYRGCVLLTPALFYDGADQLEALLSTLK